MICGTGRCRGEKKRLEQNQDKVRRWVQAAQQVVYFEELVVWWEDVAGEANKKKKKSLSLLKWWGETAGRRLCGRIVETICQRGKIEILPLKRFPIRRQSHKTSLFNITFVSNAVCLWNDFCFQMSQVVCLKALNFQLVRTDALSFWAWYCWRIIVVKQESFLSTVTLWPLHAQKWGLNEWGHLRQNPLF